MYKRIIFILCTFFLCKGVAQECPFITNPQDGSVGVPVNTTITWNAVPGIVGYLISLGTTPGGVDLLNRRSAGPVNSYTPEIGLPENTRIYVTISLFLPNQPLKICEVETFVTENVTTPPSCTILTEPLDEESGVSTATEIKWAYADRATGYLISIGSAPGGTDIADAVDVKNVLNYRPTSFLPEDADIYVKITPYNENGNATGCHEEQFNTGMAVLNCEARFDATSGTLIEVRPAINLAPVIGLCRNEFPLTLSPEGEADGYRWYRLDGDSVTLISEDAYIIIEDEGRYLYEAYNYIDQAGVMVECASTQEITTVLSEAPTITSADLSRVSGVLEISVQVNGNGNYEYALDQPEGPYQDDSRFTNVASGTHTVYVRDKNGCGLAMMEVDRELGQNDFPKFFTPNGDGINDYWQLQPSSAQKTITLEYLQVFDRYGVLIAQVTPSSPGWDGSYNGRPVPSSVYWFKAADNLQNIVQGYFMLKR